MADFTLNVDCKFMEDFQEQLKQIVEEKVEEAITSFVDKSFAESVIREKCDLDSRMDGLLKYIGGNISEKERELCNLQYQIMGVLSTILLYRINELCKDD